MKIAMLSGAYKNAGDFLIVKRCKELLHHFINDCEIVEYERRKALDGHLQEINKADVLLFAGGPAYMPQVYPQIIPLVKDLEEIKVPLFAMAMGWYGRNGSLTELYNYKFTEESMKLLNRFEKDGFYMGARDRHSSICLKQNGFEKNIMTGCAAWYRLDKLGCGLQKKSFKDNPIICISDPARVANFDLACEVITFLRKRFPNAQIKFVFHRGTGKDEFTANSTGNALSQFAKKLEDMGVKYENIAYSADGFSVYDTCDMHIGFRVHAHLYNLSSRIPSILLEEDGRGEAANATLGLPSIPCYNTNKIFSGNRYVQKSSDIIFGNTNPYAIRQLGDWLEELEQTQLKAFEWCFSKMEYYFTEMEKHISTLK